MGKNSLNQLQIIEELVITNKHLQALELIKSVKPTDLSVGEFAHYCLLYAEVKINLGDYDVENLLLDAIKFYKSSTNHKNFARSKYLYGW